MYKWKHCKVNFFEHKRNCRKLVKYETHKKRKHFPLNSIIMRILVVVTRLLFLHCRTLVSSALGKILVGRVEDNILPAYHETLRNNTQLLRKYIQRKPFHCFSIIENLLLWLINHIESISNYEFLIRMKKRSRYCFENYCKTLMLC